MSTTWRTRSRDAPQLPEIRNGLLKKSKAAGDEAESAQNRKARRSDGLFGEEIAGIGPGNALKP